MDRDVPFVTSRNIENDTMCQFGTCPYGRIHAHPVPAFGRLWWISTTAQVFRPPLKTRHPAMKGLFFARIDWLNTEDTARLGLDRGLVDKHDGDVVFYPIHTMAVRTLQGFRILTIFEGLLALRTNQHVEKVFRKHDSSIVRRNGRTHPRVRRVHPGKPSSRRRRISAVLPAV